MEILTDKNFLLYAAKHYDNPQCHSTEEFHEDLRRIKYIKKLLTRYIDKGDLKCRLILNHLIVLSNVFEPIHLNRILCLKMEGQLKYIKPFLVLLNILPDVILNVKVERKIETSDIGMDEGIVNALREI